VLGSIEGYSGPGIGPYWIPFSDTATEHPGPVSPAEAKNVRPSIAAWIRSAWSARWAAPNSGSTAGLSSQAPSEALTWSGPSGSLTHVPIAPLSSVSARLEPKYIRSCETSGAMPEVQHVAGKRAQAHASRPRG
jgi:hypothetical protein